MFTQKGILTIAVGKKYSKQAKYLAYSCVLNSPNTTRAVITDSKDDLKDFYDIIIPWNADTDPFSIKTRLFELSPFQKTLYIDADSLVIHCIDCFFDYLDKRHYVYEGAKLSNGEWYFDIKEVCAILNISWIPIFNSGMILFNKSDVSDNIFKTANYYFREHKKEGINIPYFRGQYYPDEPAFAIALAINNIEPVHDYGRFSRTLIKATNIQINVVKRIARFVKDGKFVHPQVVHFCGRFGTIVYTIEKIRLFLYFFNPAAKLFFTFLQLLRKSKKPVNTFPSSPNFPS